MNNVFSFKPLAVDQFVQTLEQEMHTEIPFGNDVPSKAVVRGEAFVLTQPNSNVAKAIDRMAKTLDAELYPDQRQQERRGLFGR
jgi:MinD-like ATPase involved in chromosome partitioning or flagellar assembly